ncbi:MaoC family dehydratase N-terminal domain-containing protein [Ureibacillus sp. Re31]|uniref:MaoC family dehydratase N-terminal domain-containing protein n=1 Tax=Ureibacillus galli TaxID=2762222 RepID=A0ABR8XAX3_9BACL|nr:MaoC/PaaZ C-terminal domain-containing protein [Ureibacillus galli]MBD8026247.1 MaoC family dehydratase N-terminal domain-containing protein [Ureibacillus galli]
MLLRKGMKLGKKIDEITVGEKLQITEKIEDKDLLLYLGLTNDSNPLYIQHDYALETPFKKPIVPTIMLNGIITSAISKHMPGPGSHVLEQNLIYLEPVYHNETIEFLLEVQHIDITEKVVDIYVNAFKEKRIQVIEGVIKVLPPH